jgi:hypothetical protein
LQIGANPLQRDNFRIPEGQDRLFDIVKKIWYYINHQLDKWYPNIFEVGFFFILVAIRLNARRGIVFLCFNFTSPLNLEVLAAFRSDH